MPSCCSGVASAESSARVCVSTCEALERTLVDAVWAAGSPPRTGRCLGNGGPAAPPPQGDGALQPLRASPPCDPQQRSSPLLEPRGSPGKGGSLPRRRAPSVKMLGSPTERRVGSPTERRTSVDLVADDPLLAFAAEGRHRRRSKGKAPRRKSQSSVQRPRFGMLGWDERVRNFGKRGKLPKVGLVSPGKAIEPTADFPGITLTQPSFSAMPDLNEPLPTKSSSSSLDELLMRVEQAALARKRRKRRAQLGRRSPRSRDSSDTTSTESETTSSSSSSDSVSDSETETSLSSSSSGRTATVEQAESAGGPIPSLSVEDLDAPAAVPQSGSSGGWSPGGVALLDSPRPPELAQPVPALLVIPPTPQRLASAQAQTPPGSGSPQRPRWPPHPDSGLTLSPTAAGLASQMVTNFSITSMDSVPLTSSFALGAQQLSEQRASPRRPSLQHGDRRSCGRHVSVQWAASTMLSSQADSLEGEGPFVPPAALRPKGSLGDLSGRVESCAFSFASASILDAHSQSFASARTESPLEPPSRGVMRSHRMLRVLQHQLPTSRWLGTLRRLGMEGALRRQVLRPRSGADFAPGDQVVHERRGWGEVLFVDPLSGAVAVDFAGDQRVFKPSALMAGKLQPGAQLPRTRDDFQNGDLVAHERRGAGQVVSLADDCVTVIFFAEPAVLRAYRGLALARGRLQPRGAAQGSPPASSTSREAPAEAELRGPIVTPPAAPREHLGAPPPDLYGSPPVRAFGSDSG
eukprot:TRINITY_DN12933_c0_g1_i1.p1 TRINITY_DN12933_c0_g1~~TRINITY_DN12933_c0_g1_i1.p1  ORF type:complete len:747 (+),score=141.89 TRINITY_DN12933_c0_g1_i1:105-2345(+)